MLRSKVSAIPEGRSKIRWYGPGLLWMLSAVGTGSILFTPRVAALYQYQLLWLMLLVIFFMWVMVREMARFSVVTGRTMLEGIHTLAGPKNWAVWLIFVPQLLAASVGIAGLCGVVGSSTVDFLPGSSRVHAIALLFACTSLTTMGKYKLVEGLSRKMAIVLLVAVVAAAFAVFPGVSTVASGLKWSWPADADLYVILPWVGTILAGSMGIVWFGYWTATRGYAGGLVGREQDEEAVSREDSQQLQSQDRPTRIRKAAGWMPVISVTAALGCVGGLLVMLSFMILGSELLAPKNLLPEGTDVATDLATMLSGVWGEFGKWLMLSIVIIALGGSVLANQDGWGRSFADMTLILMRRQRRPESALWPMRIIRQLENRFDRKLLTRITLKRFYIASVTGFVPIIILLLFRDPVKVMSASGIIAAAHTPFIVFLTLYVNSTRLPKALRPSRFFLVSMGVSGLFYSGFAIIYFLDLFGLLPKVQ